jgi:hypothetical protein
MGDQYRQAAHELCPVKEAQTMMRSFGRTVSRTSIPQEEIAKFKVVVEEIELADRMNEIVADYEKYLE